MHLFLPMEPFSAYASISALLAKEDTVRRKDVVAACDAVNLDATACEAADVAKQRRHPIIMNIPLAAPSRSSALYETDLEQRIMRRDLIDVWVSAAEIRRWRNCEQYARTTTFRIHLQSIKRDSENDITARGISDEYHFLLRLLRLLQDGVIQLDKLRECIGCRAVRCQWIAD